MTVQQNVSLSGSPGQNIVPRKGHSMVIRNDVAWILGGHNGFDLADLVSFSVPKGSLSSKQIAQCKGKNLKRRYRIYLEWTCSLSHFSFALVQQLQRLSR